MNLDGDPDLGGAIEDQGWSSAAYEVGMGVTSFGDRASLGAAGWVADRLSPGAGCINDAAVERYGAAGFMGEQATWLLGGEAAVKIVLIGGRRWALGVTRNATMVDNFDDARTLGSTDPITGEVKILRNQAPERDRLTRIHEGVHKTQFGVMGPARAGRIADSDWAVGATEYVAEWIAQGNRRAARELLENYDKVPTAVADEVHSAATRLTNAWGSAYNGFGLWNNTKG